MGDKIKILIVDQRDGRTMVLNHHGQIGPARAVAESMALLFPPFVSVEVVSVVDEHTGSYKTAE